MSADNWGICPKCRSEAIRKAEAADKATRAKYGKISAQLYEDSMAAVRLLMRKAESDEPRTLREDYELGIDSEGAFEINYRASCQTCDFKFSFKHTCDAGAKE